MFRFGVKRVETENGIYKLSKDPSARLDDLGERGGYFPIVKVEYHLESPELSR